MPVAVGRKIEYFVRNLGIETDIKLFPVVLTTEQVARYRLPRIPIKASERRGARFEEQHGSGAVELDALETLYPGELRRILSEELDRYYDHTLAQRADQQRQKFRNALQSVEEAAALEYDTQLTALRDEYRALCTAFEARMASHNERIASLWQNIEQYLSLNMPDADDYPLPEPVQAIEREGALYDSAQDYLDQLQRYKEFQGKEALDEVTEQVDMFAA
jgi:hypothetical protein